MVHGKLLVLNECKKCRGDFYGVEKQTRCDECFAKREERAF